MTNDPAETVKRLDTLEMRIAHQDRMVSDLNEIITAQWQKIDILERQIARLRDEMQNIGPGRDGPEPPPPQRRRWVRRKTIPCSMRTAPQAP